MSSVTTSTSTITSPYVTVKEQVKPGRFEANEKEYGAVGAAVLSMDGVPSSIGSPASIESPMPAIYARVREDKLA